MTTRVTDFGTTELRITTEDAARLPTEAQAYIRLYTKFQGADGYIYCNVPNYCLQQLLDAQRALSKEQERKDPGAAPLEPAS